MLQSLIPDFEPLYQAVRDYIRDNQGDKGFIKTVDENNDRMYVIEYDGNGEAQEKKIAGVRVRSDDIEIIAIPYYEDYQTDDSAFSNDADWWSLRYSEYAWVQGLFDLAEAIEQYK